MTLRTFKKSKTEDDLLEEKVKKNCKDYLTETGWNPVTLYTGGIPTPSGKFAPNPAKGMPDCLAFNLETKKMVWIEYKRNTGGRISPEQKTWHSWLEECGQTIWVVNSLDCLKEKLKEV